MERVQANDLIWCIYKHILGIKAYIHNILHFNCNIYCLIVVILRMQCKCCSVSGQCEREPAAVAKKKWNHLRASTNGRAFWTSHA